MDQPLHIGLLGACPDDVSVSFTVCMDFVSLEMMCIKTEKDVPSSGGDADVQRFDVKDSSVSCFQLESLILAQNERWRQA
jgi:hypothetical protein